VSGVSGYFGGDAFNWTFDSGIGGNPATGKLQFDSATPSLVAHIYAYKVDYPGTDVSTWLAAMTKSSIVKVYNPSTPTNFWIGSISSAPTVASSIYTIPVTYISASAGLPDTTAGDCALDYNQVGACGVSGTTGACGVSGVSGVSGACGVSGVTGVPGACGVSGVTGVPGACGVSGVTGVPGACGVSGISGVSGASTAGGDLTGTLANATVAKVNGVAISANQATLLSEVNNTYTGNSGVNPCVAGGKYEFYGSNAASDVLPNAPIVGTTVTFFNRSSAVLSIIPSGSDTMSLSIALGGAGNVLLSLQPGCGCQLMYMSSGVWSLVYYSYNYYPSYFPTGAIVAETSAFVAAVNTYYAVSGTTTCTLPTATMGGDVVIVQNNGSNTVTVKATSLVGAGVSSNAITLTAGQTACFYADSTTQSTWYIFAKSLT
jgi:hypothetical protein